MKVIYDINDGLLDQQIKGYVQNHCHEVREMTYQQIEIIDFIFKSFDSFKDIEQFKQYKIDSHKLIAVITNETILMDLLYFYPLCFIRKKNFDEDLRQCLTLLNTLYEHKETILSFQIKESYIRLNSSKIYYIEAFSHYVMLYTVSGNYMIRHTMADMIKKLKNYHFIQVHRSYIVNYSYIEKISKHQIILTNNTVIPVGKKYRNMILKI